MGGTTDYALTLELFSGVSNTFRLDVTGLPLEINRYFIDPATGNRLSQFQFLRGSTRARQLCVYFCPIDRPRTSISMSPYPFYALGHSPGKRRGSGTTAREDPFRARKSKH